MKKFLFAAALSVIGFTSAPASAMQVEELSDFANFPDYNLCNVARSHAHNNIRYRCQGRSYRVYREGRLYARQVGPRLFECRFRVDFDCLGYLNTQDADSSSVEGMEERSFETDFTE